MSIDYNKTYKSLHKLRDNPYNYGYITIYNPQLELHPQLYRRGSNPLDGLLRPSCGEKSLMLHIEVPKGSDGIVEVGFTWFQWMDRQILKETL